MRVGTLSSGRLVPPGKRVFDFGSDGFGGGVWESEEDMGKWVVKRGFGCGCRWFHLVTVVVALGRK